LRGAGAVAVAMALVVVVAGSWLGYQRLSDPGCEGQVRLTVAAASEIVPAVQQAARTWVDGGAEISGTCVAVDVTAASPAIMASAVASRHGVTLTGLGQASGAVAVPDVWIPDSSTWLLRLQSEASGFVTTDGKSVAQSPVVVAMPEPIAQQIGWPDKKLGWSDLLNKINTGGGLKTGIVDPTRDAAGLAGLLALGASAGAGPEGQASTVGALRTLATNSSALREDLLQKFPNSLDAAAIASSLSAAPLSEEDVVAFNAQKPAINLAALYLDPAPPPLDYPFAVLPEVDALRAAAADGLHDALRTAEFKNALATQGLRAPDGTVGTGFSAPIGAPIASPAPAAASAAPAESGTNGSAAAGLDAGAINQALGSWAAITLPGRVLAVFDISGSMLEKVPSAGGATRAQVTQAASRQGLALFDDKWAVGVWVFSTKLKGSQDWREVVPISPLTSKRRELQASIEEIVPKKGGATGLYDTALAAYRNVQDSWEAGRVNTVLLFTDGKNEDDEGLKRDQLISALKKTVDPKRPVRLIIIGIGNGVDRAELKAITDATGGGLFTTEDPAKIGEIFLQAISSRTGAAG
jgi:Ca-activated chloride channel family protein